MIVHESIEKLKELLSEYAGTAQERRLQLFLSLKQEPDRTIVEVARSLEIPKQTAAKWLRTYRRQGIEGLLRMQARASRKIQPPIRTASDIDCAIRSIDKRWLDFVNNLSRTLDTVQWVTEFREVLMKYLGDVDYVAMTVVTTLDLVQPDTNKRGQVYIQRHDTVTAQTKVQVARASDSTGWESVLERGKRGGFPVDLYHEPLGFDYWYETEDSHLGSILLFRLRGKPPISEPTRMRMEELRPFLIYVMSDHVARQRLKYPADLIFRDLVPRIADNANLTEREQQVLMHMIVSSVPADIAEHLGISIRTVETHIKNIYSKTGVSRMSDLWSRYMSPQNL